MKANSGSDMEEKGQAPGRTEPREAWGDQKEVGVPSGHKKEADSKDREGAGRGAKSDPSDQCDRKDDKDDESRAPESTKGSADGHKAAASGERATAPEQQPDRPSQQLDTSKEPVAIVMRAVSFVYRRMVAKSSEGGMKDFIEEHWKEFDVEGEEHRVEWMVLYKEFEAMIDKAMSDFAAQEGLEVGRLFEIIQERVNDDDKRVSKFAGMLLAAGAYDKFIQLMRNNVKQRKKVPASESRSRA